MQEGWVDAAVNSEVTVSSTMNTQWVADLSKWTTDVSIVKTGRQARTEPPAAWWYPADYRNEPGINISHCDDLGVTLWHWRHTLALGIRGAKLPLILLEIFWDKKVKEKASHTRYRALGPGLILVYRLSARRRLTISHPSGGRLPLLFARPAVTFPAAEHHCPSAVPSYTAWWQRHIGVNNLPEVVTQLCPQ